jgi:cytochrome c biogenesis protein CcmG, thiol:disulfide interchange protein DsbE
VLVAAAYVANGGPSATSQAGAGDPAPTLTGTTLDGTSFDLARLRGRPVVVNYWASWCIPCRAEFPLFEQALTDHASAGLAIVGAVYQDDADAARAFATKTGASWPSLVDPDGSRARAWRVVAPPQTYFIDRDGVIVSRQIGEVSPTDFQRQLDAILR